MTTKPGDTYINPKGVIYEIVRKYDPENSKKGPYPRFETYVYLDDDLWLIEPVNKGARCADS